MSSTAKVSISVPDEGLLQWAKERSKKTGMSLSAVFTDAVRFERQMEARRQFLDEMGADGRPTPEEAAAIRAEWKNEAVEPARTRAADAAKNGAIRETGAKRGELTTTKALAKRALTAKVDKRSAAKTATKG
ncbi:MAG: hypothetical protein JWO86_586 [Myxococcaceae bacterium]|nr:hypothetical protein [Myxococcaceae bacterium]